MSEDEAVVCRDFGPEVGRSWRRLIEARRMPEGARVTEVGFTGDDIPLAHALAESELSKAAYTMLAAIDWHSQITLTVEDCDDSSNWSRNGRRIRICDSYIERFEAQLEE